MPNQEEEILSEVDESEPEHPPSDCSPDGEAEDGRWNPGPIQPYPLGGKAGTQHPSARWLPHIEPTAATDGALMEQLPSSTGTKRRRLRKKSRSTIDQKW
jgi:hypothetical protein